MSLRHLSPFLVVALLLGVAAPAVRSDIITPPPRPEPKPPKPQPPLPPEPKPLPDDDDGASRSAVVAAVAASLGVTLLGVWVIRRQLRRTAPSACS
jgi:hypothetical protein